MRRENAPREIQLNIRKRQEIFECSVGAKGRGFGGRILSDGNSRLYGWPRSAGKRLDRRGGARLLPAPPLRDQVLIHLKLADLLPELFSLIGVAYRRLAGCLSYADGAGSAAESGVVQVAHTDLEAVAFLADEVFRGGTLKLSNVSSPVGEL